MGLRFEAFDDYRLTFRGKGDVGVEVGSGRLKALLEFGSAPRGGAVENHRVRHVSIPVAGRAKRSALGPKLRSVS